MDVDAGQSASGREPAGAAALDSAPAAAEVAVADGQQPLALTDEEEAETFAVFDDLMSHLPDDFKYKLLLDALQRGGPAVLEGIEEARDAIIYAASRRNPALLRNIVQFVESGGADEMTAEGEGEEEGEAESDDEGGAAASSGAGRSGAAAGSSSAAAATRATGPVAGMAGFAALGLNTAADPLSSAARLHSALGAAAPASGSLNVAGSMALGSGGAAAAAAPSASGAPLPGSEADMQRFLAAVLGPSAAGSASAASGSSATADAGSGAVDVDGDAMYLQGMSAQEQADILAARAAYAETQALLMGGAVPASASASAGPGGAPGSAASALPAGGLGGLEFARVDDGDDDDHEGFGLQ